MLTIMINETHMVLGVFFSYKSNQDIVLLEVNTSAVSNYTIQWAAAETLVYLFRCNQPT